MADNRTTVKSNIAALNVPSVTNANLNSMLQNELADNLVFQSDVVKTQSSTVTAISCDFTSFDRIDLTRTGGSLQITLAGISDGAVKWLSVTKTAGQLLSWVGVTDVTPIVDDVTALSSVLYEIVRKGSNYYARAFVGIGEATTSRAGILETATLIEAKQLTATNKIITPGTIPTASTVQEGIVEIATSSEIDSGTDVDSTGDQLVVQPSELKRKTDGLDSDISAINSDISAINSDISKIKHGEHYVGDIASGGTNVTITHNMGSTNYTFVMSLLTINSQPGDNDISSFRITQKTTNTVTVRLEESVGQVQDVYVSWVAIGI